MAREETPEGVTHMLIILFIGSILGRNKNMEKLFDDFVAKKSSETCSR